MLLRCPSGDMEQGIGCMGLDLGRDQRRRDFRIPSIYMAFEAMGPAEIIEGETGERERV